MWFNKALDNFMTLNIQIKCTCFHHHLFHTTRRTKIQRTVFGIFIRNYLQHTQIYSTTQTPLHIRPLFWRNKAIPRRQSFQRNVLPNSSIAIRPLPLFSVAKSQAFERSLVFISFQTTWISP